MQKFLRRVNVCWCPVAVCCVQSDMLISEFLYESGQPFCVASRPQSSHLVSVWLWWTHALSVLGRTVFWENSMKNGNNDWRRAHTNWLSKDTHKSPLNYKKRPGWLKIALILTYVFPGELPHLNMLCSLNTAEKQIGNRQPLKGAGAWQGLILKGQIGRSRQGHESQAMLVIILK